MKVRTEKENRNGGVGRKKMKHKDENKEEKQEWR